MEEFVWTPPGATAVDLEAFLTLRPGLPSNANESIYQWLIDHKSGTSLVRWSFMLEFQQAARADFGIGATEYVGKRDALTVFRGLNQTELTWLVDFVISDFSIGRPGYRPPMVQEIDKILRDSGSSWTVGAVGNRFRLVEVLPSAVADVVSSTLSPGDKASDLLRSAWESAFGVNKKPSHAYYDAVRSVEIFSCPLISPKDANATLGKDINVLRNAPHKWRFVMGNSVRSESVEHVIHMMRLLWHSQTDRHGRADYEDVSAPESQAAVLLASTLVGWLSKGMLARIDTTQPNGGGCRTS